MLEPESGMNTLNVPFSGPLVEATMSLLCHYSTSTSVLHMPLRVRDRTNYCDTQLMSLSVRGGDLPEIQTAMNLIRLKSHDEKREEKGFVVHQNVPYSPPVCIQ